LFGRPVGRLHILSDLKIQYIDLRSTEVRLAEESAKGIAVPEGADELVQLIKEAHRWGEDNKWPVFRQYPQYESIRAIGQRIYAAGGHRAMHRAGYYVRKQCPKFGYSIENFWDGVGDWIA
jgi:hypothetical protein